MNKKKALKRIKEEIKKIRNHEVQFDKAWDARLKEFVKGLVGPKNQLYIAIASMDAAIEPRPVKGQLNIRVKGDYRYEITLDIVDILDNVKQHVVDFGPYQDPSKNLFATWSNIQIYRLAASLISGSFVAGIGAYELLQTLISAF